MVGAPNLVVVGRGASGREFLASASKNRLADQYRIRVLDEHGDAGGGSERETVLTIDPARHILETASGRTLEYGALVLATGQRRPPPPSSAAELDCLVYRHSGDLPALRRAAQKARRAVVIGGGQSGLHVARLLSGLGLETHIVERASRLLHEWIDETGAVVLHSRVSKEGAEIHVGCALEEVVTTSGRVTRVRLSDGGEIAADLVVLCPRPEARDELGRASGLKLGGGHGIAIDEHCQTSEKDLFAVGSVASFNDHCLDWAGARRSTAHAAACALAGGRTSLLDLGPPASFHAFGIPVASFGDAFGRASDAMEISVLDTAADTYARLSVGQEGTKLLGGMFVGDTRHCDALHDFYLRGGTLPTRPGYLVRWLSEERPKAILSTRSPREPRASRASAGD